MACKVWTAKTGFLFSLEQIRLPLVLVWPSADAPIESFKGEFPERSGWLMSDESGYRSRSQLTTTSTETHTHRSRSRPPNSGGFASHPPPHSSCPSPLSPTWLFLYAIHKKTRERSIRTSVPARWIDVAQAAWIVGPAEATRLLSAGIPWGGTISAPWLQRARSKDPLCQPRTLQSRGEIQAVWVADVWWRSRRSVNRARPRIMANSVTLNAKTNIKTSPSMEFYLCQRSNCWI